MNVLNSIPVPILLRKLTTHDQAITGILKAIRELMNPPEPTKRPIGFTELKEKK